MLQATDTSGSELDILVGLTARTALMDTHDLAPTEQRAWLDARIAEAAQRLRGVVQ